MDGQNSCAMSSNEFLLPVNECEKDEEKHTTEDEKSDDESHAAVEEQNETNLNSEDDNIKDAGDSESTAIVTDDERNEGDDELTEMNGEMVNNYHRRHGSTLGIGCIHLDRSRLAQHGATNGHTKPKSDILDFDKDGSVTDTEESRGDKDGHIHGGYAGDHEEYDADQEGSDDDHEEYCVDDKDSRINQENSSSDLERPMGDQEASSSDQEGSSVDQARYGGDQKKTISDQEESGGEQEGAASDESYHDDKDGFGGNQEGSDGDRNGSGGGEGASGTDQRKSVGDQEGCAGDENSSDRDKQGSNGEQQGSGGDGKGSRGSEDGCDGFQEEFYVSQEISDTDQEESGGDHEGTGGGEGQSDGYQEKYVNNQISPGDEDDINVFSDISEDDGEPQIHPVNGFSVYEYETALALINIAHEDQERRSAGVQEASGFDHEESGGHEDGPDDDEEGSDGDQEESGTGEDGSGGDHEGSGGAEGGFGGDKGGFGTDDASNEDGHGGDPDRSCGDDGGFGGEHTGGGGDGEGFDGDQEVTVVDGEQPTDDKENCDGGQDPAAGAKEIEVSAKPNDLGKEEKLQNFSGFDELILCPEPNIVVQTEDLVEGLREYDIRVALEAKAKNSFADVVSELQITHNRIMKLALTPHRLVGTLSGQLKGLGSAVLHALNADDDEIITETVPVTELSAQFQHILELLCDLRAAVKNNINELQKLGTQLEFLAQHENPGVNV